MKFHYIQNILDDCQTHSLSVLAITSDIFVVIVTGVTFFALVALDYTVLSQSELSNLLEGVIKLVVIKD